jgi:hypothetical protein
LLAKRERFGREMVALTVGTTNVANNKYSGVSTLQSGG